MEVIKEDRDDSDAAVVEDRNLSWKNIHFSVSDTILSSEAKSVLFSAPSIVIKQDPAMTASLTSGAWALCCFAASTI